MSVLIFSTNMCEIFHILRRPEQDMINKVHWSYVKCLLLLSDFNETFEKDQVLLESCLQTCMTYTIAECTVNKLLMMDRGTVRIM